MRRAAKYALVSPVLAACLGLGATAATANAAKKKKPSPGFTMKKAYVQKEGSRLVYSVVVCTKARAALSTASSFTPSTPTHGFPTAKPGSTQYQSKSCWPDQVAVSITSRTKACKPFVCPVVAGHKYTIRVKITNPATRQTVAAPTLTAKA